MQDTEENKLEYTSVHSAFCCQLEGAMCAHLEASIPGFDMAWFMEQLEAREGELDAEVGGCEPVVNSCVFTFTFMPTFLCHELAAAVAAPGASNMNAHNSGGPCEAMLDACISCTGLRSRVLAIVAHHVPSL
jgi:hypothetical protein